MDKVAIFVDKFQEIFSEAGDTFVDLLSGIVPMVLVLMTCFNAIAAMIGKERMDRISKFLSKYKILSYTVLPFLGWFFLCNPMVFSGAKFLPQRQRAGYIDAVSTTNGPMLSLFPHANPAELFIWLGIAEGVQRLGHSISALAIRFFIGGWVLAIIRAYVTETIWVLMAKKEEINVNRGISNKDNSVSDISPDDSVQTDEENVTASASDVNVTEDNTSTDNDTSEITKNKESKLTSAIREIMEKIGRVIGKIVNLFYQGARDAIDMMLKNVLPFMVFISLIIAIITKTGFGNFIANSLEPLTGSVIGIIVLALIISIPVLSPLLAPGAAIQSVLGIFIGTSIANGAVSPQLALPALFAIGVIDACDFIPVAAALGEAEPDTSRIAVPAILLSRFITAPISVLIGVLFSIGLF